ncbi:hypothetical protein BDV95DRAFT_607410 [Massariosphaeria phaeospora]|uniref:Uncharacterized protein n=1 Tax=Massariosphaeria phaeospora TaxID=100035 RepID=A0A7C8I8Y1_9PLEO|nr:hypothetical protein BDV95DRAFT_607410 [Massariosphaeria phaeospora]
MDHWGDPWADDADITTPSPPKETAIETLPPALSAVPAGLSGFLDEAQWGSAEDDGFGGWASSDAEDATAPTTRVPGDSPHATESPVDIPRVAVDNGGLDHGHGHGHGPEASNEWGWVAQDMPEEEAAREPEQVVSEASDSATTIQPDSPGRKPPASLDSPRPEDDLSTRPSTSPSDGSHTEAPSESPRTSFEDERATASAPGPGRSTPAPDEDVTLAKAPVDHVAEAAAVGEDTGDDFGDLEDDPEEQCPDLHAMSAEQFPKPEGPSIDATEASHDATRDPSTAAPAGEFSVDQELLAQLFPPPPPSSDELDDAPEDPIHSTAARKAWYRLTRKQTMREFNSGNDDDNYIRVTWAKSQVRTEVNTIVGRWVAEDRISGRGPGARASFYWDQPAPPDAKIPNTHFRKKSIAMSSPIGTAKQDVSPLAANAPAAFNWSSSPLASNEPWERDSPSMRSTSSPLTVKQTAAANMQRREDRALSVDITPRAPERSSHLRTATALDLPNEATPFPPLITPTTEPDSRSTEANPWGALSFSETTATLETVTSAVEGENKEEDGIEDNPDNEDDDDWGDMIDSSAVSDAAPASAFPSLGDPPTRHNAPSTPSTTPKSVRSSPFQPPLSKHASPIVRLKGTVSPTSALFKNNFVPLHAEDGPIGPGLLRPAAQAVSRPVDSLAERIHSDIALSSRVDDVLMAGPTQEPAAAESEASDEFSAFETSVPGSSTIAPVESDDLATLEASSPKSANAASDDFSTFESAVSVPASPSPSPPAPPPATPAPAPAPPAPPAQPLPDPWATADFSIFESAPPISTSTSTPTSTAAPQPPSDPWSMFENPGPAVITTPITTTPPRLVPSTRPPPPSQQPLTTATNTHTAQKRKAEEDKSIQRIIAALPDLGYMLRW